MRATGRGGWVAVATAGLAFGLAACGSTVTTVAVPVPAVPAPRPPAGPSVPTPHRIIPPTTVAPTTAAPTTAAPTTTVPPTTVPPTTVPPAPTTTAPPPLPGNVSANGVPYGVSANIAAAFAAGPTFTVPLDDTGNSSEADWPDACAMLNLAEVQALVPGTTAFATQGQYGQNITGGTTPQHSTCQYNLTGSYTNAEEDGGEPSYLEISIQGIFDAPDNLAQWQQAQQDEASVQPSPPNPSLYQLYTGLPSDINAFWDGSSIECADGNWNVWISGLFNDFDDTTFDYDNVQTDYVNDVLLPLAVNLAPDLH